MSPTVAQLRGRRGAAARAALCIALPLVIGLVTGRPSLGATGAFGALAGLYVQQAPYRYRARVVATIGAALTVVVLVGGLVAGDAWLAVPVAGVVAGVASFVGQATELPPPRELLIVMPALAATGVPVTPAQALQHAGLTAGGAALAWLVSMSPALFEAGSRPEARSVAAAGAAIDALLGAAGTTAAPAARYRAIVAVQQARNAVGQAARGTANSSTTESSTTESSTKAALTKAALTKAALTKAEFRLQAALHVDAEAHSSRVPQVDEVTDALAEQSAPADFWWPGAARQLRAAADWAGPIGPSAVRIGVGVAIGVAVGRIVGLAHAYWVGLTVLAVLQGTNRAQVRRRVVHRLVGTVVGIGVVFAVLGWGPPTWFVVLATIVFQGLVELVVPFNYGLAVVNITALALLLFHLSAPGERIAPATGARVLDTVVGLVIAVVLRQVMWPHATAARLPPAQTRTLEAIRRVLELAWQPSSRKSGEKTGETAASAVARRDLQLRITRLRALDTDASADGSDLPKDWPVTVALEELAVFAMARPPDQPSPPAADARAFLDHLDELGAAIALGPRKAAGDGPSVLGPTPDLPGSPRTRAAAEYLREAVNGPQLG